MDPELELLMQQMAANQYGSGPAYMGAEENPYARPQSRLNYWQDIEQLLGVPMVQLAGVGAVPGEQEPPNVFQSDLGAAYGSNPLFADAFELIQGGVDPYKAMAAVQAKFDEGAYGPEAELLVPKRQSDFVGAQPEIDWDEVGGVVQQYATDQARTQRETQQYATENSPQYTSAVKDGARYANAPLGGNDPYAFASEESLYDWDAMQADADQAKQGFAASLDVGPKPPEGFGWNPGGMPGAVGGQNRTFEPQSDRLAGERTGPRNVGKRHPQARQARQNQDAKLAKASRAGQARQSRIGAQSDAFNKTLQANLNNRRDRSRQTAVRSDANANTMKRLIAAYALINGEMPG